MAGTAGSAAASSTATKAVTARSTARSARRADEDRWIECDISVPRKQ